MSYCTQCAAEIDRLMDVIAQLQEIVNSDTAEEERIRAENERLRAALDQIAYTRIGHFGLTLDDCIRVARAALEKETSA